MKTRFILFLLSFLAVNSLWGASIAFEYDAAGNRISRKVITLRSATASEIPGEEEEEEIPEEPQVFTDVLAQSSIYIYPNPTKGLLRVEINSNGASKPVSLQVYDMSGRMLLQESNVASSTTVDLSNQPAGTYILQLISDTEKNEWKIIKE